MYPLSLRLASLLLGASLLYPVLAQVITVEISGDVTDASGAAVPNASVTGKNLETGFERKALTDDRGHYRLYALPLGRYSVRAEAQGFRPVLRESVPLGLGQNAVIDFSLKPADVTETITVGTEVPLIETTNAQVGKTIKTVSIDSLPLNGRDFSQLAALAPGVQQAGSSTALYISGQSYTSSSFKVDGMDNDSEYVSGRQAKYTQDAIAEVQVLTGQFLPEFGRSGAGVINVVTRSGTNDFHGRAFFYGREDALDARNTFASSKPPFDRRQFGGTLGGPIKREKTFFFGSVERLQEDNTAFVVTPNLTAQIPQPNRGTTAFGKVNHLLNPNHTLQFIYNFDRSIQGAQAVGGTQLPDHAFTRRSQNNNFIFGDTLVLGARTVNDFRIQYQRREAGNYPDFPGKPQIDRPSTVTGTPTSTPATWNENKVSFSESLTHSFTGAGEHNLKIGAQIQLVRGDALIASYDNGNFIFSTDKPFNAADPTTYPIQYNFSTGNPDSTLSNNVYAFYINDEWRPTRRLTLNLGLRYDLESGPLVKVFPADHTNIAPRASFAWSPTANRDLVIRGGYGRFYYRIYGNLGINLIIAGAPAPYGIGVRNNITIFNPGYPDPNGPNPNGTTVATPLKTGAFSNGKEQTPYTDNFSFGASKQLGAGIAVTADYLRVRGYRYPRPFDRNAPDPATGVRPIKGFGLLYNYDTSGQTWYDAMLVTIEKRMTSKTQVLVSYTLSTAKDTLWPAFATQSGAGPQSWSNPDTAEKAYSAGSGGNAGYYEPNRLNVAGVRNLPFGVNFSGIFTFFSPRRYNITTGRDNNGDGVLADRPNFVPDAVGNARYVDPGTGPNVAGNLPRNAGIWLKAYEVLQLRLSKSFTIKDRTKLELMMESFNTLNRANYSGYQGNIRSALFGRPNAAYDPRQLQFGAKIDF